MQKRNLVNHLINDFGATEIEFNSNNGWGFGGAVGKRYMLKNNVVVTIAKACYRHMLPTYFIRVDHNGKHGVIDLQQTQSAFAKVYNFVNDNVC